VTSSSVTGPETIPLAVVANEIKELAQQTASATEDIKSKISGMQQSATGAIGEIEKITRRP